MKSIIFLFAFIFPFLNFNPLFTGAFDMIVTQNYPNGNFRTDTVSYYFQNENTAMIIHASRNQPDMRMIFNTEKETITNLFEINGEKSGYVLPMNEEQWPGMPQSLRGYKSEGQTQSESTGNAKTIESYQCKEYTAENSDYTAKLWITEDIQLSMLRILSYQSVGKGKSKKEIELFEQMGVTGLPLEMELKSKTGKADVNIQLVNIRDTVDNNVFSTDGYLVKQEE